MEVDSHFPPLTLKKEGFSEWTHIFHPQIPIDFHFVRRPLVL